MYSLSMAQNGGTASSSQDTICSGSSVVLYLSGYNGNIQWQRLNGTAWVDETGPGAQNDTFSVNLTASAEFRAFVTASGQADDSSNVVSVSVTVVNPPVSNGVSRCGIGQVNLNATGTGNIRWYDAPTGGNLLAVGNSYQPTVTASTIFYAEDNLNGGGGDASPLQITEIEVQTNDRIELQNVSPAPVDVTGWKLAISDSYTAINQVNTTVQTLSGTLQPGDFLQFSDVTTIPVNWGSNILWNAGSFPGFTGWALLLDASNNVKDLVMMNWPASEIANFAPVIQGNTISIGNQWTGGGVNITNTLGGISIQRIGNFDNNDSLDWVDANINFLATNPGLSIPMQGFGCSSARTAVNVTVTPADSVVISPASVALCQGESVNLSASSSNAAYTYSWSPANGLSTTTGPSVTANPSATETYVVFADDGTCAAADTIEVIVSTPNIAGNILSGSDTICAGASTLLTTQGYNGLLQWQQNTGSGYVNATGTGSDGATFQVFPTQLTQYRLIANSPGCPADTSNVISVDVAITDSPIVSDTARCGAGAISLSASASGNISWFLNQVGGNPIGTGASFNTNVFITTTYYVENRIGGNLLRVGPLNNGIGTTTSVAPNDQGILFSVNADCTLETVYVYPDSAGLITINLRQSAGGPILSTYSQQVQAGGKTAIPLNFTLLPGTGYRLEVAAGSPFLKRNTGGSAFPYSNALVSLTANLAPNQTTTGYYFLYDWEVSSGCRSPRVPLTVTVNPIPPVPLISINGTTLSSSASSGNQWYQDGNPINGATNQSYNVTQNGNYFVAVTVNGCTSYSDTIFASSLRENAEVFSLVELFPNPVSGNQISLNLHVKSKSLVSLRLTDAIGKTLQVKNLGIIQGIITEHISVAELSSGIYYLEMMADENKITKKISVIH
jgi:hypothetical protein